MIATAIQNGEYDFDGTREEKGVQPIFIRAEAVKAEIKEATGTLYNNLRGIYFLENYPLLPPSLSLFKLSRPPPISLPFQNV